MYKNIHELFIKHQFFLKKTNDTEHNGKAYNAYDFLHGKSKSSVEAVEQ